MRPRFANRGSEAIDFRAGRGIGASMRPRFANRGSSGGAASSPRCCSGFNEAPIRESGKWREGLADGERPAIASMRPRFANRGSPRMPRKRRRDISASMRPRFANRGSEAARGPAPGRRRASMRPRFANRGSDRRNARVDDLGIASMRPRFANRGSAARAVPVRPGVGRFNEAPIRESGKSTVRPRILLR